MLEKLGNKNFSLLARMLDIHGARHRVLAQNIANVNTPNYKRRELSFKNSLDQALAKGTAEEYRQIQASVCKPNNTVVRNNGNNVDIDGEMVTLGENNLLYTIYSQLYTKKASMAKAAIRGGR